MAHKWEACTIYMGAWDVMSSHYLDVNSPPPGVSSFGKIRLGWISSRQVVEVRPGESRGVFLSPLSKGGGTLVVKIPLPGGKYYLVENRQPVGSDRIQPDSGLLVIKVDPGAQEGAGTARIMDADPKSPNFTHATFSLDKEARSLFVDKEHRVAIIPLWLQGDEQGVLVTTPEKSGDALKAARVVQSLWKRSPEPKGEKDARLRKACTEAFERFDFSQSWQIGQKALSE
jgi:hypothetical protein